MLRSTQLEDLGQQARQAEPGFTEDMSGSLTPGEDYRMQVFGGSWFVFVTIQHSPGMSKDLRQGLISWNSPASLNVCLCLREVGSLVSVLSENVFVVSSE